MSFYNNLLNSFILPTSEYLFNIPLTKTRDELDKITQLSKLEIDKIQQEKLQKLLNFSVENSKYYKTFDVDIKSGNCVENLKKFPILTKEIIKKETSNILTESTEKLLKNGSSGSTGEQTIVYWSKNEQTINRATQLLWWKWAKYTIGDRLVQTGITTNRIGLKRYKDIFFRTKYIQAFSHNPKEITKLLKSLNPKREYILAGYASSLFVIAKIAKKNNITIKFKSAISWGDKLFSHYKTTILDTFGCKTYETYGSAEGLMIGSQKDLDYLYIMSTNVFVEIVDENGNDVEDGKLGHVLITNLNGYAMPLIRYKVGDLAIKLPENKYPEIRELNLPLFEKIVGRDTDIIKTPSGNYMVVHSFTGIFEHIPEVRQFCVIQNQVSGINIQYIKSANFTDSILENIKLEIQNYLNEPFEIIFEEVNEIKPTLSGKPQLIISNLVKK